MICDLRPPAEVVAPPAKCRRCDEEASVAGFCAEHAIEHAATQVAFAEAAGLTPSPTGEWLPLLIASVRS